MSLGREKKDWLEAGASGKWASGPAMGRPPYADWKSGDTEKNAGVNDTTGP